MIEFYLSVDYKKWSWVKYLIQNMAIKIMTYQNIALKIRYIAFCLTNSNLTCLSMGKKDWHLTWKRTMSFSGLNGTLPLFNSKWTHIRHILLWLLSHSASVIPFLCLPASPSKVKQSRYTWTISIIAAHVSHHIYCYSCHYVFSFFPLYVSLKKETKLKESIKVWNINY